MRNRGTQICILNRIEERLATVFNCKTVERNRILHLHCIEINRRGPKGGSQKRGGPKGWGPKCRACFSLSRSMFAFFLSLGGRGGGRGVFSWNCGHGSRPVEYTLIQNRFHPALLRLLANVDTDNHHRSASPRQRLRCPRARLHC